MGQRTLGALKIPFLCEIESSKDSDGDEGLWFADYGCSGAASCNAARSIHLVTMKTS
jgi:hypothetical protein